MDKNQGSPPPSYASLYGGPKDSNNTKEFGDESKSMHRSRGLGSLGSYPPSSSTSCMMPLALQSRNGFPLFNTPSGMEEELSKVLHPELKEMSPVLASPFSNCVEELPSPPVPRPDPSTQTPSILPHVLEWNKVIRLCATNDFVPQTVYQPLTKARRAPEERLQDTIFFLAKGSSELGISLGDDSLKHLNNKDDRMLVGCEPCVTIYIQWPGYPEWSKQIPTKEFPWGHITRARLLRQITTCVKHLIEHMRDKPMEAGFDTRWRIGKEMKVEGLVLVSLHHVSEGIWQPQFRIRPLTALRRLSVHGLRLGNYI